MMMMIAVAAIISRQSATTKTTMTMIAVSSALAARARIPLTSTTNCCNSDCNDGGAFVTCGVANNDDGDEGGWVSATAWPWRTPRMAAVIMAPTGADDRLLTTLSLPPRRRG
ncbi:unnamed protein product, partial [Ectocarpus fasciculatus]